MNKYFEAIGKDEYRFLVDVPVKITLMIAGADSIIDENETEWAEKVTGFRTKTEDLELRGYYRDVHEDFKERLRKAIEAYSKSGNTVADRNFRLADELAKVNGIFKKLKPDLAAKLYQSYKSMALHVARSSGGVVGFGAISPEEKMWIDLQMINNPVQEEE